MSKITDCTQSLSKNYFFIRDDKQNKPSYIEFDNGQFEVINHTQKEIFFLQIDDCLYGSQDATRCDCAIYNDDVFCFIELKICKLNNQNTIVEFEDELNTSLFYKCKKEFILNND